MPRKVSDFDRIMSFVNKDEDGHWIWLGSRCGLNREYGQVRFRGRKPVAHRAVWILHKGEIPEGLDLLHQCGQTLCVNPAHLRVGTEKENMQEAVDGRKGKHWFAGRCDMVGDSHPRCKVSDANVLKVIQAFSAGATRKELARKHGVTVGTITNIINGKRMTRSQANV